MKTKFRCGMRVRILRKDSGKSISGKPFHGMLGIIEMIDGYYIYVRPRWYEHYMELYPHEIEEAPYGK